MRTTDPGDAARIELLLAELRLPAIKLVWASLGAQPDKEGWPAGRFLAACRAATGLRRGGVRAGVGCARQSHVRPMLPGSVRPASLPCRLERQAKPTPVLWRAAAARRGGARCGARRRGRALSSCIN